jgi:hypothetical protein
MHCYLHLQERRASQVTHYACFYLVICYTFLSILKMEAKCLSEKAVISYGTARRHIPENSDLHFHHCHNLKYSVQNKIYFSQTLRWILIELGKLLERISTF